MMLMVSLPTRILKRHHFERSALQTQSESDVFPAKKPVNFFKGPRTMCVFSVFARRHKFKFKGF